MIMELMKYQVSLLNIVFIFYLFLFNGFYFVKAWDTTDFELFDVVEEVGENFYKLLNVAQDAKVADIRRAYRKLSLTMHPDKNDSPNAEVQFRNLVAVYEILKDQDKRQRYDTVLRDGLPDWRQPIYYYRKAKKMSVVELFIFLSVILTVGHYLVLWSIFLEKKFEMEELMNPVKKKLDKRRAKGKSADDDEELLAAEEYLASQIGCKRPLFADLLPFATYRFTLRQIKLLPTRVLDMKDNIQLMIESRREQSDESDESDGDDEEKKQERKKRRRKLVPSIRDASEYEGYDEMASVTSTNATDNTSKQSVRQENKEWTVKDSALLTRAMVKFPGGTPGRWEKVANELGRSEAEVSKQVKKIRSTSTTQAYKPNQNDTTSINDLITKRRAVATIDDSVMTQHDRETQEAKETWIRNQYMTQDDVPDDYDDGMSIDDNDKRRKKRKNKQKKVKDDVNEEVKDIIPKDEKPASNEELLRIEEEAKRNWSQSQQKCLELALAQFDKTVPDRWVCIARAVPGKRKEDCLIRYKELVAKVRQKQLAATTASV